MVTSWYTSYITAYLDYSLFVSKEDQEKIKVEKRKARLELLYSKAKVAYIINNITLRYLKLAKIKSCK